MTRSIPLSPTGRVSAVLLALGVSSILLVADSAGPQCKRGEAWSATFDASTSCGAPFVGGTLVPRVARIEIVATDRGNCDTSCWDTAVNTVSGEEIFNDEVYMDAACPEDGGVATVWGFTLRIPALLDDGVTAVYYDCSAGLDGKPVGYGPESPIPCSGWVASDSSATVSGCELSLVAVE